DWYGHQGPVQQPLAASPPTPDPYPPGALGPAAPSQPPAGEAVEPATEVFARLDPGDPVVPLPRPEPEPEPYTGADEAEGGPGAAPE
ncbi:class E sortase, partial [Streptomyces sp. DT225]